MLSLAPRATIPATCWTILVLEGSNICRFAGLGRMRGIVQHLQELWWCILQICFRLGMCKSHWLLVCGLTQKWMFFFHCGLECHGLT